MNKALLWKVRDSNPCNFYVNLSKQTDAINHSANFPFTRVREGHGIFDCLYVESSLKKNLKVILTTLINLLLGFCMT